MAKGGKFLPFAALPKAVTRDPRWSASDYQTLCAQLRNLDRARLIAEASSSAQTSIRSSAQPQLTSPSTDGYPNRQESAADPVEYKWRRITHVSDYEPSTDSYLCYFNAPDHKLASCPPNQWPSDWQLLVYLTQAAAVLTVWPEDGEDPRKATCHGGYRDSDGDIIAIMKDTSGIFEMMVGGFRGLRSFLQPQPLQIQAVRPPERIAQTDCTAEQWNSFARQRDRYHTVLAIQAEQSLPSAAGLVIPDEPTTSSGQQTLHAYVQTRLVDDGDQCTGRSMPTDRQSQQPWAACQWKINPAVRFDTTSMQMRAVGEGQGSWVASERHGQATLRQHPQPYRKHSQRLNPKATDFNIDAAHLRFLVRQGASFYDVWQAGERQNGIVWKPWAKAVTSRLSMTHGLTSMWGHSAVTWDPQFSFNISPAADDVCLGGVPFADGLQHYLSNSLILLSRFTPEQRNEILHHLPHATGWVVLNEDLDKHFQRQTETLRKVGLQAYTSENCPPP